MKTIEASPIEKIFSNEILERFLFELEKRFHAKEVMHRKAAADYLGVSERTLDRLTSKGSIPCHTIEGLSGKLYLRSEIIEVLKNNTKKK